jgi:hypothetical protein
MDCLDFRRRLLADPFCHDQDLQVHEAGCPACASFARDLKAQEIRLRGMFKAVSPPEGMAERISLAARFEHRAALRRRWWYGAAAAVLMAVGVSMLSLFTTSLERSNVVLAQSVIHHIEDEAQHLREAGPVPAARLKWVFERFGAELTEDIGPVHFAAECLMRRSNGVHLVLPGREGPITVFFMPGEMTDAKLPVKSLRFVGHILPTDWGSIAVVGEDGEPLHGLGERLASAVEWPRTAIGVSGLPGAGMVAAARLRQQQDG